MVASQNLTEFISKHKEMVEKELEQRMNDLNCPAIIKQAMAYSLQAGGKRIRPLLIFATLDAFQLPTEYGLEAACAVEMIHTYSLIHDDLPSMDDDDLRRGKPTNHKVFGEAIAILAGDGLLTHSFQTIAGINHLSSEQKLAIIYELAHAAGPEGMVGGQVADIEGENKKLELKDLEYIHIHKTGKLLSFCVKAGTIIANCDQKVSEQFEQFAYHLGLAFQIKDDVLDVVGDVEKIGKRTGSDIEKNKSTYPSLLSLDGAIEKLNDHLQKAKEHLANIPLNTVILEQLTDLIGIREN